MSPPDVTTAALPPTPPLAPSPEQRRAAHALQAVQRVVRDCDDKIQRKYRSYAERIGTTIITNGLGQALATELAAANGDETNAHLILYRNLASWLGGDGRMLPAGDALTELVKVDQAKYLRIQAEALAWLVWHKKLCRAFLPRGKEEDE